MSSRFVNYLAGSLFALIALLVVLHLCVLPLDKSNIMRIMFRLDGEANVPNWFASSFWLLAAVYSVIAYQQDENRQPKPAHNWIWILITVALVFASLDDGAAVHEKLRDFEKIFSATYALALPRWTANWLIIYAPVLGVFSIIAGTFLWRRFHGLKAAKVWLLAAATCYGTALGHELIVHNQHLSFALLKQDKFMRRTKWPRIVEESLEDFGTACVVVAIAQYASLSRRRRLTHCSISVSPGSTDRSSRISSAL